MYKIYKNIVPNPGIEFKANERTGPYAIIPTLKTNTENHIKKIRFNSFGYIGPKLFNLLPQELRKFEPTQNTENITNSFKNQLDKFLSNIPDQPTTPGLSRAANTNSISDQVYYLIQ